MIKSNITYQSVSGLLVIMILIISSNLNLQIHYCQKELKHINLFGESKTCHELAAEQNNHCQNKQSSCTALNELESCEEGCCDNKTIKIESAQDLFFTDLTDSKIEIPSFHVCSIIDLYSYLSPDLLIPEYLHFKPPLSGKDILTLVQIFLI